MSSTYHPRYSIHPPLTTTTTTTTVPPTWAETQAELILSYRDISTPPAKKPGPDVRDLDAEKQVHAKWTDPDLVKALSQLQHSLPRKARLSLRYGGRDVTAATWVTVHQTTPGNPNLPELKYVLWFHEYDDLDVEVGELRGVRWGVKKEEGEDEEQMGVELGGRKRAGKEEEVGVKEEEEGVEVKVKVEDMEG
ncbi:MAG: hypothetical protein ALECFALPRED_007418 [Alectoria fallacina]|uniref:Uncharacterized protein n=1 Tax=Alectoria fallacina TaxID=1903189 RepID=A0A8H3EUG4_9LECA|nr:MAG: hypothetical protein ALECFALPRED_007418 [Alectoria fallacina]